MNLTYTECINMYFKICIHFILNVTLKMKKYLFSFTKTIIKKLLVLK